jgi:hypothetical protein
VAVVSKLAQKIGKRQSYIKGETVHKTIQKHRIQKMENKNSKQENKSKRNIKKHKSGNQKMKNRSK